MQVPNQYAALYLEQQAVIKAKAESDKRIEEFVKPRLERLRSVGCSVARKSLPKLRIYPSDFDNDMAWVASTIRKINRLTTKGIVIESMNDKNMNEEIVLPLSLLVMTDRDFAKKARQSIQRKKIKNIQENVKKLKKDLEDFERKNQVWIDEKTQKEKELAHLKKSLKTSLALEEKRLEKKKE